MSGHWDRDGRTDDFATNFAREGSFGGQGHDRIHGDNLIPGVTETIAMSGDMSGDNDDIEIDITAGQKMISAMSGSLLTSLLGECQLNKNVSQFADLLSDTSRCRSSSFTITANHITLNVNSRLSEFPTSSQ